MRTLNDIYNGTNAPSMMRGGGFGAAAPNLFQARPMPAAGTPWQGQSAMARGVGPPPGGGSMGINLGAPLPSWGGAGALGSATGTLPPGAMGGQLPMAPGAINPATGQPYRFGGDTGFPGYTDSSGTFQNYPTGGGAPQGGGGNQQAQLQQLLQMLMGGGYMGGGGSMPPAAGAPGRATGSMGLSPGLMQLLSSSVGR